MQTERAMANKNRQSDRVAVIYGRQTSDNNALTFAILADVIGDDCCRIDGMGRLTMDASRLRVVCNQPPFSKGRRRNYTPFGASTEANLDTPLVGGPLKSGSDRRPRGQH